MINQNFLRVYRNAGGSVTIATGSAGDSPFENINIEMISISNDDLMQISIALSDIADQVAEEEGDE